MVSTMSQIKPTYGYYRQPNGWITASVVTDLEELKYRREGWEPLPQYGRFDMGTEYMASHPLECLFQHGGAGALCDEQIRQTGLYMNPPLVPVCGQSITQNHKHHQAACWVGAEPVYFPQLEHMADLGPFPCEFCGAEKPTIQARDQHESVMHKDELSNIRTGKALANALIIGQNGASAAAPDLTALLGEMEHMRAELAALRKSPASAVRRRRTK